MLNQIGNNLISNSLQTVLLTKLVNYIGQFKISYAF